MISFARSIALALSLMALSVSSVRAEAPTGRGDPGKLGFRELVSGPEHAGSVSVTWYGVATLLFDDGRTKILIDGYFSRPELGEPETFHEVQLEPDIVQVERMIKRAELSDLAAITAVHSHFDHALDLGVIARSTGAVVLGSMSTANIARGAGVPENQIRVVDERGQFSFGDFRVSLIRSAHAPLRGGKTPTPGIIEIPLVPPATHLSYKEGGSYSIVLAHPSGTALIQGSAGYVEGNLNDVRADVVFLGTGGLSRLGPAHAERYFAEVVQASRARCVVPIHWDDMYQPFGSIVYGGQPSALEWLRGLRTTDGRSVEVATLPFGKPIHSLFGACDTDRVQKVR